MSSTVVDKKRSAERQLNPDDVDENNEIENSNTNENDQNSDSIQAPQQNEKWKPASPKTLSERKILTVTSHLENDADLTATDGEKEPASLTTPRSTPQDTESEEKQFEPNGFLAYSKVNPFATTISTTSTKSPKSPKVNPFSSPSPAPNPFMSYVENKDGFWNMLAKGKEQQLNDSKLFGAHSTTFTFPTIPAIPAFSNLSSANSIKSNKSSENLSTIKESDKENSEKEKDKEKEKDSDNSDEDEPQVNDEEKFETPLQRTASDGPGNVENGEAAEKCIMQLRVKLYKFQESKAQSTAEEEEAAKGGQKGEWIEVGIGPLKVLQSPDDNALRIVMRRENQPGGIGTKLLLNVSLKSPVSVAKLGEKAVKLTFIDSASALPVAYTIKTKHLQESDDLYNIAHKALTEKTDS